MTIPNASCAILANIGFCFCSAANSRATARFQASARARARSGELSLDVSLDVNVFVIKDEGASRRSAYFEAIPSLSNSKAS